MRYIPLNEVKPNDEAWTAKTNILCQALRDAPDQASRNAIIDNNSEVWGELKLWLLELSHGKCWFSEAQDCFSHWDVEHFRPKKSARELDGTEHDGYWWLAFDWTNFRICGNVGNRKKGTYFPLRNEVVRVGDGGDLRLEEPLLLDPADPDDPALLFFNAIGETTNVPGLSDQWEVERVTYSIERYRLNSYQPIVSKRMVIWGECQRLIDEYKIELETYYRTRSATSHLAMREKARQIRSMIGQDRELSAVARACLESTGDPRIVGLSRTQ